MKRTLSLILAALLLASAMTACNNTTTSEETKTAETKSPETAISETAISETDISETDAPSDPYNASLITENGIANAHIVLLDGADQLEKYASEELAYHIKLVSGAEIPVTNAVQENSLPIIIATPDSLPALEDLFPGDLEWLRDLGNPAEDVRFSDDGFAIRQLDNKLYIFGATPRGALNGVYDFIEDNMGVLWIRAENMSDYPIIYDEMPTIDIIKADYREKSPFPLRAWSLHATSQETSIMWSRNKLNALSGGSANWRAIGIQDFLTGHSIKDLIFSSPSYDPTCTEYWGTDSTGRHHTHEEASDPNNYENIQVNFWSDITMQCIADSVIAVLDASYESTKVQYVGISLQDSSNIQVYPENTLPYEYAPGQFIDPSATNYISTVYFSFINKIARQVAVKYPDVKIHAYAYWSTLEPAECELEPNVYATFCPIDEDLSSTIDNPDKITPYKTYVALQGWCEKTPNVMVYNYYGCFVPSPFYCRPIWYRMQSDMQLYAENGFNGVCPEGFGDIDYGWMTSHSNEIRLPLQTMSNSWSMNAMVYWLFTKLAWNPYENVDALIEYYCDKVYGDAAKYMKEYNRLLMLGWKDGGETMETEFNSNSFWWTSLNTVWDYFVNVEVDGVHILEAIKETLHKAYDAGDDRAKAHIKYVMDTFDNLEYLTWGE